MCFNFSIYWESCIVRVFSEVTTGIYKKMFLSFRALLVWMSFTLFCCLAKGTWCGSSPLPALQSIFLRMSPFINVLMHQHKDASLMLFHWLIVGGDNIKRQWRGLWASKPKNALLQKLTYFTPMVWSGIHFLSPKRAQPSLSPIPPLCFESTFKTIQHYIQDKFNVCSSFSHLFLSTS